jgi:hypothetical protein
VFGGQGVVVDLVDDGLVGVVAGGRDQHPLRSGFQVGLGLVAGDAGRGQSLIVWAIAEGRSAAAAVDLYLEGDTQLPSPIAPTARPLMV